MAMGVQGQMIEAAARAGVKWILPTEYAGDGLNEGMVDAVPLFHPKREARRQIEELSKEYEGLRWIGVATGPWLEAVSLFFPFFPFLLFLEGSGFGICSKKEMTIRHHRKTPNQNEQSNRYS
jgi:hypothetical protein